LATIITHPIPALVVNQFTKDIPSKRSLLMYSILLTILPDADVIGFGLGIQYEDMLGHRGFSHSIVFALLVSFLIAKFRLKYTGKYLYQGVIVLFLSTISHGILDGFTNGGLGVGYFIPFDSTRYFFPFTPIEVSPIGIRNFLSMRGLEVLWSEAKLVWIPSMLIFLSYLVFKKLQKRKG
tara:strand:+ start:23610 stop:24149 length:540 start_codon:yes stop_codon:yes gene_type:complete